MDTNEKAGAGVAIFSLPLEKLSFVHCGRLYTAGGISDALAGLGFDASREISLRFGEGKATFQQTTGGVTE
jgi:hypothetical protein